MGLVYDDFTSDSIKESEIQDIDGGVLVNGDIGLLKVVNGKCWS